MVDNELDGALVERIARVRLAVDLAAVSAEDIDAFLGHLEVEPFTDAQVERIFGRIALDGPARDGPARPSSAERSGRFPVRRSTRATSQGYRLSCEELENRLPPSVCGPAAAGAGLMFGMTLATVPASATVRLWEARHVMEVQGSAGSWQDSQGDPWSMRSHDDDGLGLPGGDAAAEVPWEALFSEMDCPVSCELQLAG